MKAPLFHSSFLAALFCALLLAGAGPADAAPAESFEHWLEKYGAWDQLEKEYATQESVATSETSTLKRAEVYLNLNSPDKALEIVEMTPAFDDDPSEASRLWIGGQAHRALGDLSRAVLWFSQASRHMDDKTLAARCKAEPRLDIVWRDAWRNLLWTCDANFTASREAQLKTLNESLEIAEKVWGGPFWEKARFILERISGTAIAEAAPQTSTSSTPPATTAVSPNDTRVIGMAAAALSLQQFDKARELLNTISASTVRQFWLDLESFLESGSSNLNMAPYRAEGYLKPLAFWSGDILSRYAENRDAWFLGNPDSTPWTRFRNELLDMAPAEAYQAIDKELGSMLISEQTARLLRNFKLAYALTHGETVLASSLWANVDKRNLPLSLKLAGMLLFKENLKDVLTSDTRLSFQEAPLLSSLSGAAGLDLAASHEAPFWTAISDDQLEDFATDTYPMDRLLLLAYWQQRLGAGEDVNLAKRAAFLFKGTSFGIQSLLSLADHEVRKKDLRLAAFYLNQINERMLPEPLRASWLDAKIRLELESGRPDKALETYTELVSLSNDMVPAMTRLRVALLLQQRRNFKAAERELLALWEQRGSLSTELQAETLFWLGEGEQGMGNSRKALDYYLKLAWQYPQENIWALTAMYRASIIYERNGKYETAKRLLGTVVKQADRKEQRDAAKARLAAIEKKMGRKTDRKSALVYPF
ncbi:tetratricopeptide repeat protein [Pseudodesulfovibrio tunisiensis]|uniref:tetratricopeptide repeat protein n=1 Tax=Pseudodesulfovibrio tunisiensis TaxID=463192 RepID=UPI001FB3E240|nr:tetratricopeptide repeat protein [Pseudodesulfovibrio tunisiensis]